MLEPHEVVDKFLLAWLDKNHPEADTVFLAGSFGRAINQSSYKPVASSDLDMIILYSDLKKGGFHSAYQVFSYEDVGSAVTGTPRIMMVDTNIHDFASLHYHDLFVRDHLPLAYVNRMIHESYIVRDRLGIGSTLQKKAGEFLAAGPSPITQEKWQQNISRLSDYLEGLRSADSVEEKRFMGMMVMPLMCEFALTLMGKWNSGTNQSYRRFDEYNPAEGVRLTQAFSSLVRQGSSEAVEALLEEYIGQGTAQLATLPAKRNALPYPVEQYVSKQENDTINQVRLKFLTEHVAESLETSHKRGEMAWLETLCSTVTHVKACLEVREGKYMGEGREAVRQINMLAPDLLPAALAAADGEECAPLQKQVADSLTHLGSAGFSRLECAYNEDLARIYAINPTLKQQTTVTRQFNAGFKP